MTQRKILLVGVDGAEPALIEQWVNQGMLPNMAKIIKGGVFGRLKSTVPASSAAAWTSAVTGVNPGKHGIFEFVYYDGYTRKPVNSTQRKAKAIWQLLNAHNRTVGILNVPITFPPEKVEGFMVSGLMAGLDTEFTYPKSLRKDLVASGYRIDIAYERWASMILGIENNLYSVVEDVWNMIEKRKEATHRLKSEFQPDFFMVVFAALDRIQHQFWKFMNPTDPSLKPSEAEVLGTVVQSAYQKIDDALGEILNSLDDNTNLIIFSDHGFGPEYKCVRLNVWFKRMGLLNLRTSFTGILRKLGITEANLVRMARRIFGLGTLRRLTSGRQGSLRKLRYKYKIPRLKFPTLEDFDWKRTKACYLFQHMIKVNLAGREPEGIVDPGAEYEQLLREIANGLLELRDSENGEKMVKAVHRREEIYSGECLSNAPDLIVEMEDGYADDEYIGKELVVPSTERMGLGLRGPSGCHRPEGVFMAIGPDISAGVKIQGSEILDITPTVLYLMGVPIPSYIDGKVLTPAIDPSFLKEHSIRYEKQEREEESKEIYSKEEIIEIEDRLRALGYL